MCKWLSYGKSGYGVTDPKTCSRDDTEFLARRELSLTLHDDIYVRYVAAPPLRRRERTAPPLPPRGNRPPPPPPPNNNAESHEPSRASSGAHEMRTTLIKGVLP